MITYAHIIDPPPDVRVRVEDGTTFLSIKTGRDGENVVTLSAKTGDLAWLVNGWAAQVDAAEQAARVPT
jgi:hypothetical protein